MKLRQRMVWSLQSQMPSHSDFLRHEVSMLFVRQLESGTSIGRQSVASCEIDEEQSSTVSEAFRLPNHKRTCNPQPLAASLFFE